MPDRLLQLSHRADATPAAAKIAAIIRRDGPITFDRFMDVALYDPEVGYYSHPSPPSARTLPGPGPTADYVTSSELHPAFSTLLTRQLAEMWGALGEPTPFWLVEGGPGTGVGASAVMWAAEREAPRFAAALRLALIERSPALRAVQATTLALGGDRVRWLDAAAEAWPVLGAGCVFANELLDALPVHRVVMGADGLREIYVGLVGDELQEVVGPVSTPALAAQIAAGGGRLEPGQWGEVSLAAPHWVRAAAGLIERGYLLLLDYGEPADRLYGPTHPRGTLRSYWRQTMNEDPLARVGRQDITAHVDFSAVTRVALEAGLTPVGATRQATLLARLGWAELTADLVAAADRRADQHARRTALGRLVDPGGLGRILAVAFARAAPGRLTGFGT